MREERSNKLLINLRFELVIRMKELVIRMKDLVIRMKELVIQI